MAVASAGLYASLQLIPDNHANIPPLSFFTGRMPFLPPNQEHQSTKGREMTYNKPGKNVRPSVRTSTIKLDAATNQIVVFVTVDETFTTI